MSHSLSLSHQSRPILDTLGLILSGRMPVFEQDSLTNQDWDTLTCKALPEGVAPLLYWNLSQVRQFSSLPSTTQRVLREEYIKTLAKNRARLKELEVLSYAFSQADIPMIALKGICYLLTIYPDPGLRPMSDIDILVPKDRLNEAVDIVKALGYEKKSSPGASPVLKDIFRHEVFLQKKSDSFISFELHHTLIAAKPYTYHVPVDWFWEQAEFPGGELQSRFKNMRILSPTAQVLYAASHIMLQHGGSDVPLRWLYDLNLLLCQYQDRLDWELLLSQACTFDWEAPLGAALSQTQAYFDTPVPEHVRASLPDSSTYVKKPRRLQPVRYIQEVWKSLVSLGYSEKIKTMLALLFPAPAFMRRRYHFESPWFLPFSYLFRWWRILVNLFSTLKVLLKRVPTK